MKGTFRETVGVVKRVISLALLINLLTISIIANAEGLVLTGELSDKLTLTSNNKDIFKIENIVPGDTWERTITVKNKGKTDFKVSLVSIKNDNTDDVMARQMTLTLSADGKTIYDGAYLIAAPTEGIVINSGKSKDIIAKVGLKPSAGNEVQGKKVNSTWTFEAYADETPVATEKPVETEKPVKNVSSRGRSGSSSGVIAKGYQGSVNTNVYKVICLDDYGIAIYEAEVTSENGYTVQAPELNGYRPTLTEKTIMYVNPDTPITFNYYAINSESDPYKTVDDDGNIIESKYKVINKAYIGYINGTGENIVGAYIGNINNIAAEEGAAWAIDRVGQGIDTDGYAGYQCTDLVDAYCMENWGISTYCHAKALINLTYPSGWYKIKMQPGFVPQPGDIVVWTSGTHGHCGIVIEGNLLSFKTIEQNAINSNEQYGHKAAYIQRYYTDDLWFIRPPFRGSIAWTGAKYYEETPEGANFDSGYVRVNTEDGSTSIILDGDRSNKIDNETNEADNENRDSQRVSLRTKHNDNDSENDNNTVVETNDGFKITWVWIVYISIIGITCVLLLWWIILLLKRKKDEDEEN